jgi:hypothetical protein
VSGFSKKPATDPTLPSKNPTFGCRKVQTVPGAHNPQNTQNSPHSQRSPNSTRLRFWGRDRIFGAYSKSSKLRTKRDHGKLFQLSVDE